MEQIESTTFQQQKTTTTKKGQRRSRNSRASAAVFFLSLSLSVQPIMYGVITRQKRKRNLINTYCPHI
jgi:hypothetical protein